MNEQRAEKERKEELSKRYSLDSATESCIDAIYYHEMYHSDACWRTNREVDRESKKLTSKSAKLNGLKENI